MMKFDARSLLNKRKLRKEIEVSSREGNVNSHGTFDARKVLNSKRSGIIKPKNKLFRGSYEFKDSVIPLVKKTFEDSNKHVELPYLRKRVEYPYSKKRVEYPYSKKQVEYPYSKKHVEYPYSKKHDELPFLKKRVEYPYSKKRVEYPYSKNHVEMSHSKKHVEMSRDGNIIITAQSTVSSFSQRNFSPTKKQPIKWGPADVDTDNIEHLGIDDVIDMDFLPPAFAPPNRQQFRNRFKRSLADEVLAMQNTMVADQEANPSTSQSALVYVTNLHPSVSKQDVMELFGDVGVVKRIDMPQVGTAVVEFYDVADATRACETYHNRLLDGQAMRCFLQPNNTPSHRVSVSQSTADTDYYCLV